MINEQAANAFKTAKTLTALYARLDVARDCITVALDNLPKDFDIHQIGRINDLRNILSREMAKIWDLRESEERRSCEQPPEPPKTPCKCAWCSRPAFKGWDSGKCPYCGCQETEPSPAPPEEEVWVTQDLVPDRPNFDQWRWVGQNGKDDSHGWHHSTNSPYFMHGYIDPANGQRFEVRCRRKDLPTPTPPETNLDPRSPESTPAEDQTNLQLAGSHGDYSLPVMDIDVQIFPPDPVFIQVDNPGIPNMLSAMLKDAYHKPIPNETRITSRVLPASGISGV